MKSEYIKQQARAPSNRFALPRLLGLDPPGLHHLLEANGGLAQLRTGWLRRQWRKVGVVLRAVWA
jgi:hypothetical protein